MYEYKFEKIDLSAWYKNPQEDYRQIITEAGKDGWELVQIFAPPIEAMGTAGFYELIFKKRREP